MGLDDDSRAVAEHSPKYAGAFALQYWQAMHDRSRSLVYLAQANVRLAQVEAIVRPAPSATAKFCRAWTRWRDALVGEAQAQAMADLARHGASAASGAVPVAEIEALMVFLDRQKADQKDA